MEVSGELVPYASEERQIVLYGPLYGIAARC